MSRHAELIAAWLLFAVFGAASPAQADFSACESAYTSNDPHQQIDLYTICLTKSGMAGADRAGGFNNRGLAYERVGEEDKAFNDFTWSIESDPNWGTAYLNRGYLYRKRQDWPHALADFDRAAHLAPVNARPKAFNAEARLLLDCPDPSLRNPAKAIVAAKASLRLRDDAATHDILADAYAAVGQADDAVSEESRAVELAGKSGDNLTEYNAKLEALKAKAGKPAGG
jgi:tetratricopeptide (TPR) repeat protein